MSNTVIVDRLHRVMDDLKRGKKVCENANTHDPNVKDMRKCFSYAAGYSQSVLDLAISDIERIISDLVDS